MGPSPGNWLAAHRADLTLVKTGYGLKFQPDPVINLRDLAERLIMVDNNLTKLQTTTENVKKPQKNHSRQQRSIVKLPSIQRVQIRDKILLT